MKYSILELVLFVLAFMAGYYAIAHYTTAGKVV
jgi:hypothetical protein